MKGHSKNQRNSTWFGGFFIGFLCGGLLGALVMLLQAPNTGKQTRSKIQKEGAKLRRQATEGIEDVVAEASDIAHQFTDNVQASVNKGTDSVQATIAKGTDSVQASINKGTESVHKGVGDLQQRGQELLAEAKK